MPETVSEVCIVQEIKPHPNADRLEIAVVKGWDVVVAKDFFSPGDKAIHVAPDALVPEEVAINLGVEKYLQWAKRNKGFGRVREARLRGIVSYGFLVDGSGVTAPIGTIWDGEFGLKAWEPPPPKCAEKDAVYGNPRFYIYAGIENWRNRPELITDGEDVIASEKIHGMNCRIGAVLVDGQWEVCVGSHKVQRNLGMGSMFEAPLCIPGVKTLLSNRMKKEGLDSFILYGELYGEGIQDLNYGVTGKHEFLVFDIRENGEYWSYIKTMACCKAYDIPTAPVLYKGPFNADKMKELAEGYTTLTDTDPHIREGIVVRPPTHEEHPLYGRRIVKFKSEAYVLREKGTEFK